MFILLAFIACASEEATNTVQREPQADHWLQNYVARDSMETALRLSLLESEFSALHERLAEKECSCRTEAKEMESEVNEMLETQLNQEKLPKLGWEDRMKILEQKAVELKCDDQPELVKKRYIERLNTIKRRVDESTKEKIDKELKKLHNSFV